MGLVQCLLTISTLTARYVAHMLVVVGWKPSQLGAESCLLRYGMHVTLTPPIREAEVQSGTMERSLRTRLWHDFANNANGGTQFMQSMIGNRQSGPRYDLTCTGSCVGVANMRPTLIKRGPIEHHQGQKRGENALVGPC